LKTDVEILKTEINELKMTILSLQNHAVDDVWLDAADVKRIFNISDSTLYRYRKDKTVPFSKLGGKILYPKRFFTKSLMQKVQNIELL
jgi:hypothetical protein